ncbi:hypothetical protein M0805_007768 [Coniferiporia weirii]|nr:hypothetical protein M0805_007768 [Coniferiporia weirii]
MLGLRRRLGALGFGAAALQGVWAATPFQLVQSHQGQSFLNNWDFYSGPDVNLTGNVMYQSQSQAQAANLTYLNDAGNYIIKVDNTTDGTNVANFTRGTIKILTSYTISSGNLVLFDAVHLPYGCSVWPAFWSQGPVWPDNGEIDIIEGVNLQTQNSISLHSLNGCRHPNASVSNTLETGTLISTDCFNQTDYNQGCIVQVPGASYGAPFAQSGGGVYALNWNASGLYMWFFPRGTVPADLPTDAPNPDGWGLPTAAYPTTDCDASTFISPQSLILDITVCGNFAGTPSVFKQTCGTGLCSDLVPDPTNYDNAYFEIAYMKVFEQTNGTVTPPNTSVTDLSSTATVTETSTGDSGAATTSASPTGDRTSNGAVAVVVHSHLSSLLSSTLLIGAVAALFM